MALTESEYKECRGELDILKGQYQARLNELEAALEQESPLWVRAKAQADKELEPYRERLRKMSEALARQRSEVASVASEQNRLWLPGLPDPLGLIEKLTDGLVRDPLREFLIKPFSER